MCAHVFRQNWHADAQPALNRGMASELAVQVRHSGIWQLCSAVLSSAGQVLVIDPGYFPRELSELAAVAASAGQVQGVVFTHGHWDHVIGWRQFPSAPVLASAGLVEAVLTSSDRAQQDLREAASFDRRWYVERGAPHAWPPPAALRPLAEGQSLSLGTETLQALHLPGHSPDGLGLWAASAGLLIVGDYLSPCEIPFVADLPAYRATLRRLLALLPAVERVLPGHGPVLTMTQARDIALADLTYLDALAECSQDPDPSAAAQRALALPLPRAAAVPEMQEHHRDNIKAAGLQLATAAARAI